MGFRVTIAAAFALLLAFEARADVHFMTGEYETRSTDFLFSSQLEFARSYSSLQSSQGWFGFGWISPLDWKIQASSTGAIRLVRGNDALEFYDRSKPDLDFKDDKIEAIVAHQLKSHIIQNDDEAKILRANLRQNRLLFKLAWDRTFLETLVSLDSFARGDRHFFPESGSGAGASFVSKEWSFDLSPRERLTFDSSGHLIRMQSGGAIVEFQWTKDAPSQIRSGTRVLAITTSNGCITQIESKSGANPHERIAYRYSDSTTLTEVKASAYQETYRYGETGGKRVMTLATHDGIEEKIEYSASKTSPRVSSFSVTAGSQTTVTRFQYDDSSNDALIYRTTASFVDAKGKISHAEKHEYLLSRRDSGDLILRTHRLSVGKQEHRTTFDENGKILFEKTPTERWAYEYDGWGRLITRLGNRTLTQYRYDDDGRVTQLIELDIANRTLASIAENPKGRTAEFAYDSNGLLKQIKSSSGLNYQIDVDANGRPVRFTPPREKRAFSVTYDSKNRVSEIRASGLKPLQIRYLSNGSVDFSLFSKSDPNTQFVFEAFVRAKLAFESLSSQGGIR